MEFLNRNNLPTWVHKGLTASNYNRDGIKFDISCTKLIDSPQIAGFWKSHGKLVVDDSSDRVWSAFGSAVHEMFEGASKYDPNIVMEKRFRKSYRHPLHREPPTCGTPFLKAGVPFPDTTGWEKDDIVLAGQIDAYEIDTATLFDLKTTGAFKITKGDYTQWENQCNVNAALMRHHGYEVKKLAIVALVKDWSALKALREAKYPQAAVVVIDIPLWSSETADDYIEERLKLHFGDGPKTCSDAERWIRPGKWSVMKPGGKRALRLLDSEDEAIKWAKSQLVDAPYEIVERPTLYTRCGGYCNFSQFCEQHKGSK